MIWIFIFVEIDQADAGGRGRKQKKSKSPRKESERKNEPVAEAEEEVCLEPKIRQKTEQLLSDASASIAGAVKFQITWLCQQPNKTKRPISEL